MSAARATTLAAVAALYAVAIPSPAWAFRTGADQSDLSDTERVRWPSFAPGWELSSSLPMGLQRAPAESTALAASAAWAEPSCSDFRLAYRGWTSTRASPDDGASVVGFHQSGWLALGFSSDAAAVTDLVYERNAEGSWEIVEGDVHVNAEHFEWTLVGDPPATAGRDLTSVLTHEFGHFLGLAHPCESGGEDGAPACDSDSSFAEATMYPVYRGPVQATLDGDDVSGLCFLYPETTGPCAAVECGSDRTCVDGVCLDACGAITCDEGLVCRDGSCESEGECTADADCGMGRACRGAVCIVRLGEFGDPCQAGGECHSSACASGGYCTQICTATDTCPAPSSCVDGLCDGGDRLGVGSPCSSQLDCLGERCLQGATAAPVCSRYCRISSDDCPTDWQCTTVEAQTVCAPRPAGACSVVRGKPRMLPTILLVCFLAWRMSRRRRRYHSTDHSNGVPR